MESYLLYMKWYFVDVTVTPLSPLSWIHESLLGAFLPLTHSSTPYYHNLFLPTFPKRFAMRWVTNLDPWKYFVTTPPRYAWCTWYMYFAHLNFPPNHGTSSLGNLGTWMISSLRAFSQAHNFPGIFSSATSTAWWITYLLVLSYGTRIAHVPFLYFDWLPTTRNPIFFLIILVRIVTLCCATGPNLSGWVKCNPYNTSMFVFMS